MFYDFWKSAEGLDPRGIIKLDFFSTCRPYTIRLYRVNFYYDEASHERRTIIIMPHSTTWLAQRHCNIEPSQGLHSLPLNLPNRQTAIRKKFSCGRSCRVKNNDSMRAWMFLNNISIMHNYSKPTTIIWR